MIAFDSSKTSFGRHETFPLRFGWLTKGYAAHEIDSAVFGRDDATVTLGVGKNMVSAIKYWLTASTLIGRDQAEGATELGLRLFSREGGWDKYLEDEVTLWLVHWLIASNAQQATACFWFFNRFHKPEFSSAELYAALREFVSENVAAKVSDATLKNDVAVLLRMYAATASAKTSSSEDGFDSPLATLGMLQRPIGEHLYASRIAARPRLPVAAFGYAITEVFDEMQELNLPIKLLAKGGGNHASPGTVFRLTEEGMIAKIEELIRWMPAVFELRESAGIYELYRSKKITKFQLLQKHYARVSAERAA